MNDSLIIISPKQAEHNSQGVTSHYLFVELQRKDLHEPDAEICELVSVHAEIDKSIKQVLVEHNADDISELLNGIILQKQQVNLVNQGSHVDIVL